MFRISALLVMSNQCKKGKNIPLFFRERRNQCIQCCDTGLKKTYFGEWRYCYRMFKRQQLLCRHLNVVQTSYIAIVPTFQPYSAKVWMLSMFLCYNDEVWMLLKFEQCRSLKGQCRRTHRILLSLFFMPFSSSKCFSWNL